MTIKNSRGQSKTKANLVKERGNGFLLVVTRYGFRIVHRSECKGK